MTTSEPAALGAPVLLTPRVLDGAIVERLLERGTTRPATGGDAGGLPGRRSQTPATTPATPTNDAQTATASPATATPPGNGLSEGERAMLDALKARDREVRAHEEAHARVGGRYAGEPSYTYQRGPDGGRYAVGGSVAIDVAPVEGDPEATIAKMAIIRAAALAPAEPSASDRRIAAIAEAETRLAVAELSRTMRPEAPERGEADALPDPPDARRRALDGAATRFLENLRALFDALDTTPAVDRLA